MAPALDDAARSLGEGPLGVLRRVHVPLLYGTLAYAGLLVFIDVMKELPATLVLRPFNFETLATRVEELRGKMERMGAVNVLAVVIRRNARPLRPTYSVLFTRGVASRCGWPRRRPENRSSTSQPSRE